MGKVADVKLGWKRSPSPDVDKVRVIVTNDGQETSAEFGVEVEELQVVVRANTSLQYKVVTIDKEKNETVSAIYSFSLGDLEAPLPATDLTHTILGVRDEEPGTPEAATRRR